jgi:DNA-binding response OmpR family regulator
VAQRADIALVLLDMILPDTNGLQGSPIAMSSSTTKMTGFIFASARGELVSV